MRFKCFDWYSWLVALFVLGSSFLFLGSLGFVFTPGLCEVGFVWGVGFCLDSVSFYLLFLSSLLGVSLLFFSGSMSLFSRYMIMLSIVSSFLCYTCVHVL